MIHHFNASLLNEDGTYQTQEIDGAKGILVRADKQTYGYQEILDVVNKSYLMERWQYGWDVKFVDDDRVHKHLFIRSSHIEKCNDTTSSNQTIHEWIDHLYDKGLKQINLFEEDGV